MPLDVPVLDKPLLRTLLPHAGAMCLLDKVLSWDRQNIHCVTRTHRANGNPLRIHGELPVEAGIEYAAQAMAIHGSLCEEGRGGPPRVGYLAVLSQVQWSVQRLDDVPGQLNVTAEMLAATSAGSQYRFSVSSAEAVLLHGQALVALDNVPSTC